MQEIVYIPRGRGNCSHRTGSMTIGCMHSQLIWCYAVLLQVNGRMAYTRILALQAQGAAAPSLHGTAWLPELVLTLDEVLQAAALPSAGANVC